MRVEDGRVVRRARRPLAIVLIVIAVIVVPTWLWFVRGRRLQVEVLVVADRYVVGPGEVVQLHARVRPSERDAELVWGTPEPTTSADGKRPQTNDAGRLEGMGARARWVLPRQPGVYTALLRVRRSGSVAEDAVSVEVVDRAPQRYAVIAPSTAAAVERPSTLAPCPGAGPSIVVRGKPCRGANLVVEIEQAQVRGGQVWFWWEHDADDVRKGRLVNLRVPRPPPTDGAVETKLRLRGLVRPRGKTCGRWASRLIAVRDCDAGPRPGVLFADFGWRLLGPGSFRLVAKPPRVPVSGTVTYQWQFGDGQVKRGKLPAVVHRYADGRRYHVVSLLVEAGGQRLRTQKAVTDRTIGNE